MVTNTEKNLRMLLQVAKKQVDASGRSASPADGKGDTDDDIQMCLQSIKETIVQAVQLHKYKNGMFESLISEQTSILTDLQLLSCSVFTTAAEKSVFKEATAKIRSLLDRSAHGERNMNFSSSLDDYLTDTAWMSDLSDVFEQDMHASGQYVPPMMLQSLQPDGTVRQTTTIESSSGVQNYVGGVVGVPPGAPSGFDSDLAALFRNSKAKREGERIASHHRMAVADPADMLSADSSTDVAPSTKDNKPSRGGDNKKGDQKGFHLEDFGIDFKENLKRAFG